MWRGGKHQQTNFISLWPTSIQGGDITRMWRGGTNKQFFSKHCLFDLLQKKNTFYPKTAWNNQIPYTSIVDYGFGPPLIHWPLPVRPSKLTCWCILIAMFGHQGNGGISETTTQNAYLLFCNMIGAFCILNWCFYNAYSNRANFSNIFLKFHGTIYEKFDQNLFETANSPVSNRISCLDFTPINSHREKYGRGGSKSLPLPLPLPPPVHLDPALHGYLSILRYMLRVEQSSHQAR